MAVDIFLKLGDIQGEATDKDHSKEIDILSWNWSVNQPANAHLGAGHTSGKVNIGNIILTKWIDSSTPNLLKLCCSGKHIQKASLVVRKAGGDKPLEYIKIHLEDVVISSVVTGCAGNHDRPTETTELSFGKVSFEYSPQNRDGSGAPSISMGWDIRTCSAS